MATQDAVRMSPRELHDRIARGENIIVLDVRTADAVSVHPPPDSRARVGASPSRLCGGAGFYSSSSGHDR